MWDCANRHCWCCCVPGTLQKHPNQSSLLAARSGGFGFSAAARMLATWLSRRRMRYLLLILCSPFLIPLIFATCPFICAVEVWLFVRRRRRRSADGGGGEGRRGGDGDEVGLLQRYLEDQLMLAVGSGNECGGGDGDDEEEDGVDVEYFETARPLLQ